MAAGGFAVAPPSLPTRRDYELTTGSSEAQVQITMSQLMRAELAWGSASLRRLAGEKSKVCVLRDPAPTLCQIAA